MSEKKLLLHLSLMLCLLYVCPVQAQNQATSSQAYKARGQSKELQKKSRHDEWLTFPYTIQFSPYMGLTKEVPQLLQRKDTEKEKQRLRIIGVNLDIGVLQIREFIWKHFHCYPKLGLVLNYGRLENKGHLAGGRIYLEPQYDYLARWEISPRLGIGVAYANIPGTNFKEPASKDEEAETSDDALAEDFYQQGLHLDLSLALAMNIRLTPQWQLIPSIGYSYMPLMVDKGPDEEEQRPQDDKDLKILTASIGLSYTPNPSLIRYPDPNIRGSKTSSRVDIGLLAALKKFEPPSQEDTDSEGKYHYVEGIYGQWSLQLCNSHALTLATEWIYDGAAKQALKKKIKSSPLKAGLLLGHEFRWGKFMFGQQIGVYLMNNVQEEFPLYARLGIDYRLTNSLFVGTSFKAVVRPEGKHFSVNSIKRDFIDLRIGYSFY